MIVYGDRRRVVHVRAALERLAEPEPGVDRLLRVSELACGLLDWAHARRGGCDDTGELEDASHELVLIAARGEHLAPAIERLGRYDLPGQVPVNAALEGFAHDAVDPDQYARAARYARASAPAPDRVLGIRSIGLPLAAVVAASLGPGAVLASVRPVGERSRRSLAIGSGLRRRLCAGRGSFAVVDQGPGLSGSSFAAVARWLAGQGVPAERVAFFPSHGGGPGPDADEHVRRLWRGSRRHVAEPDLSFLTDGADAVDDLAGGRWRYRLGLEPSAWPPADGRRERRKLIVERGGRPWLFKFAGLGAEGHTKASRARALAAAGLHPEVGELRRGFLASQWHDRARPLFGATEVPRHELILRLADYLAARAAMPASDGGPGASPEALLAMAAHNGAAALGDEVGRAIDRRWRELVPKVAGAARPVAIDGRLHRWEWIALPEGALLKTDAVDHALGHDLVGEQDLAWDLAGAEIEHELTADEVELVRSRVGRPRSPEVDHFHRVCYAAFQLGLFAMAESNAREAGHDDEAARLAAEVRRYRRQLSRLALGD